MIEDMLRQIDHETVTAPQRMQELAPMIRLGRNLRPNRSGKQKKSDRRRAKVAKASRKGNRK